MNFTDTRDLINRIKELNLNSIGRDEIMDYISKIQNHAGVIHRLPAGTVICRSVDNFLKDKKYPLTIQELSYNPNIASCKFNRANWEVETVFYGSISDDIMKSIETSQMEIISLENNAERICQETVFVGKWVLQKDLELVFVGGGGLLKETQKTGSRNTLLTNHIIKNPEKMLSLKLIDNFLCGEFSKSVDNDKRWQYKISAGYATFLKEHGWPGLIYPSVKSNGGGLNVSIFPHIIDSGILKLEYVAASIFYKRDTNIVNEYVMESRPEGDKLIWKEIYHHKLPPQMKAYYSGRSDNNSFAKYIPITDLDEK